MKHPEASYDLGPLSSHVSSDILVLQWMRLRESGQFWYFLAELFLQGSCACGIGRVARKWWVLGEGIIPRRATLTALMVCFQRSIQFISNSISAPRPPMYFTCSICFHTNTPQLESNFFLPYNGSCLTVGWLQRNIYSHPPENIYRRMWTILVNREKLLFG